MASGQDQTVKHRKVFYIPGYDPIHPRRYRELYRKESAAQAEISGYEISISARSGGARYGWAVQSTQDDHKVETEIDVLVWSDIVRDSMSHSIPATYLQLARTAWTYVTSGALRRLMWLRKGPVIAALYPVGMLLLQLGVAMFIGWGTSSIIGWGIHTLTGVEGAILFIIKAIIWLGVAWAVLSWFKKKDGKFFAYYLMHDYSYSARWKGANPPELEARMTEFRHAIRDALQSDVDEVLVVGHSSGAHLAVSILSDLIREGAENTPALGFLSLGQVVPMVSFLPKADRLRRDLAYLSMRDELFWLDVTAPGDGCAFALCDPVAVSGVAPVGQKWPLVISAAFTQTLSPKRWQELRWRFFRLHFQYLCAFDRVGDYDYFRITAGPMTLANRFATRQPSKSVIAIPASKYTSMAA